mgnify:CR=1 FL=1
MKEKTIVFFYNPADVLDDETASLFFNNDGTDTMGNAYLPKTPVIVKGFEGSVLIDEVYAVFTTVEEFIQNPPEYLKVILERLRESEGRLGAEEIANAFNWYDEELEYSGDTSTDVCYSVFKDGTLVYSVRNLKGGVK